VGKNGKANSGVAGGRVIENSHKKGCKGDVVRRVFLFHFCGRADRGGEDRRGCPMSAVVDARKTEEDELGSD